MIKAKLVGRITGYENLANAIIIQAVEDYRYALRRYMKLKADNLSEIKLLEDFFKSEWYEALTDVAGTYLITQIRKEEGYERYVELPR